MRFLLKPGHKATSPRQRHIEIVDTEKQEQTVAWLRVLGAGQNDIVLAHTLSPLLTR
jgi:hypothetical protein